MQGSAPACALAQAPYRFLGQSQGLTHVLPHPSGFLEPSSPMPLTPPHARHHQQVLVTAVTKCHIVFFSLIMSLFIFNIRDTRYLYDFNFENTFA